MDVVSLPLIAKMLGVPFSTVDFRIKQWGLNPSIRVATNKGVERLFSRSDTLACVAATALHKQGIGLGSIRKAIAVCRAPDIADQFQKRYRLLVANNRSVWLAREDALFLNPTDKVGAVVVMDLALLSTKLDDKLREISRALKGAKRKKRHAKVNAK